MLLQDQQAKLDRLLNERVAHYKRAVDKGIRPLEWASAKQGECEAIRRTFAFLVANADWIRDEHRRRCDEAARRRELDALRDDPAVAAVLDALPCAAIADVREISPAPGPAPADNELEPA